MRFQFPQWEGAMGRLMACVWAVALAMQGCGDGGLIQPEVGSQDTVGVDAVANLDIENRPPPTDNGVIPEPDTAEVSGSTCAPGEGCLGEPCAEGSDCLSEICTIHMGEKVCSKTCDSNCPDGWSCTLISDGSDSQYVCVSNFSHLCVPCTTADGCTGDSPNVCVTYPDGMSFCGGSCGLESPCPEGYGCQQVENTSGGTSYQCVPESGVCGCSDLAATLGLSTPCTVTNETGVCSGVRLCTEDGLGICDATNPSIEACDGIDNDCNGLVDDGTCDDGNACTTDACAGEAGCTYELLDQGECLDGDACTHGDHCEAGICLGEAIVCFDDNPCTDDGCDKESACQYVPNNDPCSDGEPCTVGDTCKSGQCASGVEVTCNDGNPCTDDSCGDEGCVFAANEGDCDDQNACTQASSCQTGACLGTEPINCDDGNDCTTNGCHPVTGCSTTDNALPCSDGDACTLGDACSDGGCASGDQAATCDDGNPCTDDACHKALGCIFSPNADACDDKNSCTTSDVCVDGACIGSGSLACDDGNPCTIDSCLTDTGCSQIATAGACDDGDACTINDSCVEGGCQSGASLSCNDGNPCTDEACEGGDCVFTHNVAPCDDDNACSSASACEGGACKAQAAVNCDDGEVCTQDSCDVDTGCETSPLESPCEDGNVCTVSDSCVAGSCDPGPSLGCDDNNPCTDDTCDVQSGCVLTPNDLGCEDGNVCTVSDSCIEGSCVPGDSLGCDDQNICTDDTCDIQSGCVFTAIQLGSTSCGKGICLHTVENCKDGQPQQCDPLEGAVDEICDGVDNDCDGDPDEDFVDTDLDGDADCVDLDDDDDGDPDVSDCAPLDETIHNNAEEICLNGVDDDCDAETPDDCLLASCYAILQDTPGSPSGDYTVDPTGGDGADKFLVTCDMTTDGGGWNVVNDVQVINVVLRHAKKEHTFNVGDYGYPPNLYQFEKVYVNFKFAGELDDPGIFVKSYFNDVEIGTFNNGVCNVDFTPVDGWPRTETVNSTSFKLGSQPGGDVDVDCGNGQSHGINQFTHTRFRITPL